MKAILISIRPKFCELIANGEKTIEVRKTRPKIETPFKCYIYCTIGGDWLTSVNGVVQKPNEISIDMTVDSVVGELNGKVIGEFICDEIIEYPYMNDGYSSVYGYLNITRDGLIMMRLEYSELETYGDGKTLYGLHISDLKIYDEPKELSEFVKPCIYGEESDRPCFTCEKSGYSSDMCIECFNEVTRPPQSWCYVEEL